MVLDVPLAPHTRARGAGDAGGGGAPRAATSLYSKSAGTPLFPAGLPRGFASTSAKYPRAGPRAAHVATLPLVTDN